MTRITKPTGVLPHAIYHFRTGEGLLADAGTLHVLNSPVTFRRRDGPHQRTLEGFEAFDQWGAHRLIPFEEVGISTGAQGSFLEYVRPATSDEHTLAEAELCYHESGHLRRTARLLAEDFLHAEGSIVEAIGVYGSLGRRDTRPGDYDIILFVSQEKALEFLRLAQERGRKGRSRRREGSRKIMPSVLVKEARLPPSLAEFFHLPKDVQDQIEFRLRGNLTHQDVAEAKAQDNLMAAYRWKKLDLQVLPLVIDGEFRRIYDEAVNDPDFLRRIRPDICVFDTHKGFYTQERARELVHWTL